MTENLPDTNVGNIEYIRKQDAVKALDGKIIVTGHENADAVLQYMKDISNKIKSLEPADVAPVVRCGDCENWQTDWNPAIPERHYCAVMDSMMKADDFCSYGERKE